MTTAAMPPSGLPDAMPTGPHDIEEIIPYVIPWWQYAVVIAIILAVIAAAFALWYWLKNRKKEQPAVVIDHWAELSEKLQRLNPEQMLAAGQAKEYYYQLSLMLRTAIELSTQIRATDMTYRELAPLMEKKLRVRSEELRAMQDFLKTADLVKFADRPATSGEAAHFKQQLMLWVTTLKPRQDAGLPSEQMATGAPSAGMVTDAGKGGMG
jgi:hypothetical protein